MAEPPKENSATSIAALDDGWGDLLDAAPPPTPVATPPVPTFADDALSADDDDASSEEGIPLPTPVPLRTRVPTKPVLRGIREESQPIDVLMIVRDVEPSDGIPRPVEDDAIGQAAAPPDIEPSQPIMAVDSATRLRAPVLAPLTVVDDEVALPPIVDDDDVVLPPVVDEEPPIAAAPQPVVVRVAVPERAAPLGRPMPLPSAPPERSGRRTLWLGAAGVAALLVVGVVTTRKDDAPPAPPPAAHVASAAAHGPESPEAESPPTPAPAPVAVAVAPRPAAPIAAPPPEPVAPAVAAAPPPTEVAPAPAEPPTPAVDAPASGSPVADAQAALDAGDFKRAHELARAAFKIDRDNEAMRIMATAACQLDDGALAREAYRSLAGPHTRTDVFTLCRERGVDVRAKTKGYTSPELLAKARRMAELGNPEEAYEIARDSNREKRSAAALELMGICACKMKSVEKAGYVAGLVSSEARKRIADECTATGVELPAEG